MAEVHINDLKYEVKIYPRKGHWIIKNIRQARTSTLTTPTQNHPRSVG